MEIFQLIVSQAVLLYVLFCSDVKLKADETSTALLHWAAVNIQLYISLRNIFTAQYTSNIFHL